MKRSRIFLGITTALLAVAGVAAAKAHRAPVKAVFYYTQVKVTNCYQWLAQTHCQLANNGVPCVTIVQQAVQLYTDHKCINPAFYRAE